MFEYNPRCSNIRMLNNGSDKVYKLKIIGLVSDNIYYIGMVHLIMNLVNLFIKKAFIPNKFIMDIYIMI